MKSKTINAHVLEEIWKESGLTYVSDLASPANYESVYHIILDVEEEQYPTMQWEEAYEYIFREYGVGKLREDILCKLKRWLSVYG